MVIALDVGPGDQGDVALHVDAEFAGHRGDSSRGAVGEGPVVHHGADRGQQKDCDYERCFAM